MSKSRLKAISIRQYPEETDINDWIKNQKNLAESTRLAFRVIAQRYGTGDLRNALIENALQNPSEPTNEPQSQPTHLTVDNKPNHEVEVPSNTPKNHDDSANVKPTNRPFSKKQSNQLTKDEFNNIDL